MGEIAGEADAAWARCAGPDVDDARLAGAGHADHAVGPESHGAKERSVVGLEVFRRYPGPLTDREIGEPDMCGVESFVGGRAANHRWIALSTEGSSAGPRPLRSLFVVRLVRN